MSPVYPHYPLRVLGCLESDFKEKFCAPRQSGLVRAAKSRLKIRKEFQPRESLRGLEGFSHVWILSYFHLNTNKGFKAAAHPPRLRGATIGVFASRSPHRPSAIGLTLAKLDRIDGDTLYFSGLDLVEGTPVLDIKPYIPSYDRPRRSRAGWTTVTPERRLKVVFAPAARRAARALGLTTLVREALCRDPRNPRDGFQNAPSRAHVARLRGFLVCFTVARETARVISIARDREGAAKVPPPQRVLARV